MFMKLIVAMVASVTLLSGCEAMRVIAPQTAAGFQAGGILGALDGATGAVLARCRTLDGLIVRVAVDSLAIETGAGDTAARLRAAREKACRVAANVGTLVDAGEEVPLDADL